MLQTLGNSEEIWWGVDAVVPVPLHPKRKKYRGFNQAFVLAKIIAREKDKALITNCLVKAENRPPQTIVEAYEREKNIKEAFAVKKANVKDKVILLVDDVYTTGATVKECCDTLLQAGAKEVRIITLAQA